MNSIKILMLACLLFIGLFAQTQAISVNFKYASLCEVLETIAQKTGYDYICPDDLKAGRITLSRNRISVDDLLKICLQQTGYCIRINDGVIMVYPSRRNVAVKVISEESEPMQSVSISVNSKFIGATDDHGMFLLKDIKPGDIISFSCVVCIPDSIQFHNRYTDFSIVLRRRIIDMASLSVYGGNLLEPLRKAGTYLFLNNESINRQVTPTIMEKLRQVTNGLLIKPTSGLPGSSYNIQLRGQNSIGIYPGRLAVEQPLIVIDGIPFTARAISFLPSMIGDPQAQQASSPLAAINPEDIESIEVLKDADATVLYGSRGAKGVILINTKKGKVGKTRFDVKYYFGIGRIVNTPDLLNTQEYVRMRKVALYNDNIVVDKSTAPDLTIWDTTRYTDFKKMMIGGRSTVSNAQVSLSGGNVRWQYLFSTGFYNETTVFPSNLSFKRGSLHNHITYKSKRLNADIVCMATGYKNNSLIEDLTKGIYTAPNAPDLYDADGRLVWQTEGVPFNNPMALLLLRRSTNTLNTLYRIQTNYRLSKTLQFKLNVGGNSYYANEKSMVPAASYNPYLNPITRDTTDIYLNYCSSLILELQLKHSLKVLHGRFTSLLGATLIRYVNKEENSFRTSSGKDSLTAPDLPGNTFGSKHRFIYKNIFARLGYQYKDKYIINITTMLEGSSRFGPLPKYGLFNAVEVAWVFSKESFFTDNHIPINFGKVRASSGIVGNDPISEYRYSNNRQVSIENYQGYMDWEINRKFEASIELKFKKLFLSVAWYRNRTRNQVISTSSFAQMPGLIEVKNSSAIVQNTGWELLLETKTTESRWFDVCNGFSLTIPRNKLLTFPGLQTTPYTNFLVVGQSLSVQQGYRLTGINPITGLYEVADLNKDGKISDPEDYSVIGNLDPSIYGNWQTSLTRRDWVLDIYMEGRIQKAFSYLYQLYYHSPPGTAMVNQPVNILNYWRQPGDQSAIQQFTTQAGTPASRSIQYFLNSDGRLTNASYIRLKSIVLSYTLDQRLMKKLQVKKFRIFLAGNNLFTITRYKGTDPETNNIYALPPLRTILAGFQCSF